MEAPSSAPDKKKANHTHMDDTRGNASTSVLGTCVTKDSHSKIQLGGQIDHITIGRKWRRSLRDVRVKRGADAASDHHLVVAELKTQLKAYNDQAERPTHKFNVQCLKEKQKSEEFKIELRNKFSVLSLLPEETIAEQWHSLQETWKATCTTALGRKTRKHKEWITSDTWTLITERKNLKD